jgi:asparaginyl-tRNA synthetase
MVEPEVAWIDLDGVMDLAEDFLCFIVQRVLENNERELKLIDEIRDDEEAARVGPRFTSLQSVRKPFPRIHHRDAVATLRALGSDITEDDDFGGDDETILTKQYDRPILVHHYPAAVKAFYMKKDPAEPRYALAVDMLAPEGYGEIIGAGQREDDHDTLLAMIQAHGLPVEAFDWYLDLRKYGSVPHGGFGLGLERTVAWICGLPHVRETIPFARMLDKVHP